MILVILRKVLGATADHHLSLLLSWLVQLVVGIQIVESLTLVMPIVDQDELTMVFHLSDLGFCKAVPSQVLGDQVLVRLVDCRQTDMEWDSAFSFLVAGPQGALEFPVEGRLSCTGIT